MNTGTQHTDARPKKRASVYLQVFIIMNDNISAYFLTINGNLTGHSILLISSQGADGKLFHLRKYEKCSKFPKVHKDIFIQLYSMF